jgi:hypothetical protein
MEGRCSVFRGMGLPAAEGELLALTLEARERLLAIAENNGDQDKLSRVQQALQR